jgi:hypothetical protein
MLRQLSPSANMSWHAPSRAVGQLPPPALHKEGVTSIASVKKAASLSNNLPG